MCRTKKMKKAVAILQSNYIPWKGYFDLINSVDEFIIYDEVQFTKRDWRNRNVIKTPQGLHWLTIPVLTKGKFIQPIIETEISDHHWEKKHWETIKRSYGKAPYFNDFKDMFEEFYLNKALSINFLSQINYELICMLNQILSIDTTLSWSSAYKSNGTKSDKLLDICLEAKATHYLSGPAAKCYLNEDLFNQHNIEVLWMDYSNYREYTQLYPLFEHGVSILDLLFNEGLNAKSYMKSF